MKIKKEFTGTKLGCKLGEIHFLDQFQFRWLNNSAIKIGNVVSNSLMFNHLKLNSSKRFNFFNIGCDAVSPVTPARDPRTEKLVRATVCGSLSYPSKSAKIFIT